ncbi:MAG: hypothetical protein J4F29_16195 [Candidatus Latescibacteria bacterium]|nr:hypothetical protein [Candidatus Latescibacterota bacterium]
MLLVIGYYPQKKTRVSGVQLAASQASSFERFSQMKIGQKWFTGGGAGNLVHPFILKILIHSGGISP